jgi:hypothetical protein
MVRWMKLAHISARPLIFSFLPAPISRLQQTSAEERIQPTENVAAGGIIFLSQLLGLSDDKIKKHLSFTVKENIARSK